MIRSLTDGPKVPRYFFDVYDGRDHPDTEGIDLHDLIAVRREAVRAAGEILQETANAWTGQAWTMNVVDEAGRPVMTLRFSATMHV